MQGITPPSLRHWGQLGLECKQCSLFCISVLDMDRTWTGLCAMVMALHKSWGKVHVPCKRFLPGLTWELGPVECVRFQVGAVGLRMEEEHCHFPLWQNKQVLSLCCNSRSKPKPNITPIAGMISNKESFQKSYSLCQIKVCGTGNDRIGDTSATYNHRELQ